MTIVVNPSFSRRSGCSGFIVDDDRDGLFEDEVVQFGVIRARSVAKGCRSQSDGIAGLIAERSEVSRDLTVGGSPMQACGMSAQVMPPPATNAIKNNSAAASEMVSLAPSARASRRTGRRT